GNNNYQFTGSYVASRVTGSPAAILRTQTYSTQQYQRPDSDLEVDPNATAMDGTRINESVGKTGGGVTRWNVGATRMSAGYEINDAGFLNRADSLSNGNWFGLNLVTPTSWYRQLYVNFNQWNDYTTDGLVLNHGGNINFSGQLLNQW